MMNDLGVVELVVMAAVSFPLAFGIARVCLAGVIRVLERPDRR